MIPESIRSRWEKERIENIHDSQAIADKFGWRMVRPLIEMEIARRKRELQGGTRKSFFNSEQEKRANRWLKRVLSSSDPESAVVRLLSETPELVLNRKTTTLEIISIDINFLPFQPTLLGARFTVADESHNIQKSL